MYTLPYPHKLDGCFAHSAALLIRCGPCLLACQMFLLPNPSNMVDSLYYFVEWVCYAGQITGITAGSPTNISKVGQAQAASVGMTDGCQGPSRV